MRTIRNGVVEDIPLREGEATVDVKGGLEMMLGFLFGDLERMKRRVAELEEELAKYRNDDWTGRVTYDNVVDLIASNEDAAVRDQKMRPSGGGHYRVGRFVVFPSFVVFCLLC